MSWIERVATQAGIGIADAERMLRRRGIVADRPLRPARRLTITRITFAGEKRGKATGRFEFDWSPLTPGVWAVASYGSNFVGKSSVLEVLLWCLRGQPRDHLQVDVRGWLERVSVGMTVDAERYVLDFAVEDGRPDGTLSRVRPDDSVDVVEAFGSEPALAAVMSQFMMDTLDLDPVPAFQKEKKSPDGGHTVLHGWLALSGALYFGGDHKLLLGDVHWGALPARMLQMYVGLPWAQTVMHASAAQKEIEQESAQATRAASDAARRASDARARLEQERSEAETKLAAAGTETATAEHLAELAADVARLGVATNDMERLLARAEENYVTLRRVADDDERAVRDIRENLVATQFFNGLRPTCCPRCETSMPAARIRHESEALSCYLCSEPIALERIEDVSDAIAEAESRREASDMALSRARTELDPLRSSRDRARTDLQRTTAELRAAAGTDAFRERRAAELELARIEGALRERGEGSSAAVTPADAALVAAALAEAKTAFDAERGNILEALNAEVLRLGRAFGIAELEHVALDASARMRLQKGGETTSFSKLTPGERLRLRIATAIALLRVGRERGVGRHPGLLVIDSPGAEETNESNLETMLEELTLVARETPGLQVFLASTNAPAVTAAVGTDHCRVAAPGSPVW